MASVQLSTKPVGTVVKLRVNGTLKDFIIVQRGKPSALYNNAWNTATILLMKEIYENRAWNTSGHAFYSESTVHSVLNNTFIKLLDATIQNNLLSVKVPYRSAYSGTTISSGDNGLSTKCFLLSAYESGFTTSDESDMAVDGSRFAYFQNGSGTAANNLRIANYGGSASTWWTRTPIASEGGKAWYITTSGALRLPNGVIYDGGVRPAIALPNTMMVSDDGTVTVNSPPTAPGAPSATTPIKGGGSTVVKWSAASDVDGNLSGYFLERAFNSGAFSQIYKGSSLTCTDNITKGWTTVQYRVKAYDSAGTESSYATGSVYTVVNNQAPTTPGAPSVATPVHGGADTTVTWSAATDPDGNLSGYILERAFSGGGFTQIYEGAALTYKDSVTKGWTTVQYRVKAYDSEGAESGYATSSVYTVNNNDAPIISGSDTDLGNVTQTGVSYTYTVTDDKIDNVSVVITLNGSTYQTLSVKPGVEQTLSITGDAWREILNGAGQTITIQATDTENASSGIRRITFTKDVTTIDVYLGSEPVAVAKRPRRIAVSISVDVPTETNLQIQACNNGLDDAPAWEDITAEVQKGYAHVFDNTKLAADSWAVDVRITIQRAGAATKCIFRGATCVFETVA